MQTLGWQPRNLVMRTGQGTCSRCNQIPIHQEQLCAICLAHRKGWNEALITARDTIRSQYKTTPTLGVQRALLVLEWMQERT